MTSQEPWSAGQGARDVIGPFVPFHETPLGAGMVAAGEMILLGEAVNAVRAQREGRPYVPFAPPPPRPEQSRDELVGKVFFAILGLVVLLLLIYS